MMAFTFQNFCQESRQAVFVARMEASITGADVITPDHLFLGIARVAPQALAALFEDSETYHYIRLAQGPVLPRSFQDSVSIGEQLSDVFQIAAEEALAAHVKIGVPQLLIAIIFEGHAGIAMKFAANDRSDLRRRILG